MKRCFGIVASVLLALLVASCAPVIKGRVIDSSAGVPEVKVSIKDTDKFTTTKSDGAFSLPYASGGSVVLSFDKQGYLPGMMDLGVKSGNLKIADLRLVKIPKDDISDQTIIGLLMDDNLFDDFKGGPYARPFRAGTNQSLNITSRKVDPSAGTLTISGNANADINIAFGYYASVDIAPVAAPFVATFVIKDEAWVSDHASIDERQASIATGGE